MLAEVQVRWEKTQVQEEGKTEPEKCQGLKNVTKSWWLPLKVSIIVPTKVFAENILISTGSLL